MATTQGSSNDESTLISEQAHGPSITACKICKSSDVDEQATNHRMCVATYVRRGESKEEWEHDVGLHSKSKSAHCALCNPELVECLQCKGFINLANAYAWYHTNICKDCLNRTPQELLRKIDEELKILALNMQAQRNTL